MCSDSDLLYPDIFCFLGHSLVFLFSGFFDVSPSHTGLCFDIIYRKQVFCFLRGVLLHSIRFDGFSFSFLQVYPVSSESIRDLFSPLFSISSFFRTHCKIALDLIASSTGPFAISSVFWHTAISQFLPFLGQFARLLFTFEFRDYGISSRVYLRNFLQVSSRIQVSLPASRSLEIHSGF